MNIHEYQAKELYRQYGVPTSAGFPAFTVEEAVAAAQKLPGPVWVVKAQIHAGGRGKGTFKEKDAGDKGGVRLARSIDEVKAAASQMLGRTLVTVQTGSAGRLVRRLYIEDGSQIARELYLSALVDRATSRIAFIASTEGGMDIEKVAHETPEKIFTLSIDPAAGYSAYHGRKIAFALGLSGGEINQCVAMVGKLYRLFVEKDMSLLEINPLVVTKDGKLICARCQVQLRRQRAVPAPRDRRACATSTRRMRRRSGVQVRPDLRRARRQHRLPGQRRGSRDGDDGHHQAARRASRRTSSTSAAARRRRRSSEAFRIISLRSQR